MLTPARPTLHTLHRLAGLDGWNDVHHQRMVLASDVTLPVWQLEHPAIKKAAEEFPGDISAGNGSHKYISGLIDPRWLAIKTQRFRGAVWEDPATGQAWLCDVGLRREGENEDFYASFMSAVQARGPEIFYPTEEDQQLLLRETTKAALDAWNRQVSEQASAACVDALTDHLVSYELLGPTGALLCEVTIAADQAEESDAGDGDVEILVELDWKDWAQHAAEGWVAQLIQTSINPVEQEWRSYPINGKPNYSIVTTAALVRTCQERILELPDTQLGISLPGVRAHHCNTTDISTSIVNGTAMKALCGTWFVYRQPGDDMPVCPKCESIYQRIPA